MTQLSASTFTFLFTDIEGSTRLWERHGGEMQRALTQHDALLRQAMEVHGGHVFKTVGDAFCGAFGAAPDAVTAALEATRALNSATWPPEIGTLRVRMAIHTGQAEQRDDDYFGPSLNRVARLLGTGHGGQILLSLASHELVRDHLPAGVELRDLGQHRLKDLQRPEQVFQMVAPGLDATFPPLRSLDSRANNLPAQATIFIGREQELAALLALLARPSGASGSRLVTLTGPGGTGKTRLAVQVAAEALDDFEDGVYFVPLAPVSDAGLVATTIAQVLNIAEDLGQSLEAKLAESLRSRQMLLVLDNFEQVAAAAPLLVTLLAAAPELTIMVTSRAVLRLYGEQEFPVPPLTVPEWGSVVKGARGVEALSQYSAVALFIQRAQLARPDFAITNDTAPAVAEICARLDGLPLAIELAAARVKVLPPKALLARLEHRLQVLTGGARDLPARQQTLRGAIAWSYELLDAQEKTLFQRLSVFVGGSTLEAVDAVCNGSGDAAVDVLDGLASLIDKSLLRQEEQPDGNPRFTMLETIREYAQESLMASGEEPALRRRHALFFVALAEEAEPELRGPRQATWLAQLEREHDNLRTALGWARRDDEEDAGLRLPGALWRFWYLRGHLSEGQRWLEDLLAETAARAQGTASPARAKALHGAGTLAHYQGDYARAIELYEQSLALRRQLDDKQGMALTLNNLGAIAQDHGDYTHAIALHEEGLALRQQLCDRWGIAQSLGNLGSVAAHQGDYVRATALIQEALVLHRQLGDRQAIALSLNNLGDVARRQGDLDQAVARFAEALSLFHTIGDTVSVATCLEGLAEVFNLPGQLAHAARLWGASAYLRESIGVSLPAVERHEYERVVTAARATLGETPFTLAWEEGRSWHLHQIIADVLATVPPRSETS